MRQSLSFLLLSFLLAAPLAAESKITGIEARAAAGTVSVRFSLHNGFDDPELIRSLQNGLPTGFSYRVEIFRKRPNWFDDTLASSTIEVICTYNSVTREYLVNYRRDRKLVRSETFRDFALVRERMTNIDEPELFRIGSRRPYKHRIRVRAEFGKTLMLFVVPRTVTTDWKEARIKTSESS
jgi:hypothetical protein